MWKIKKILAPTDLSELSRAGLRYALEMAESQGAEVVVYSVVDYQEAYPPLPEAASPAALKIKSLEEVLDERKQRLEKLVKDAFPEFLQKIRVRLDVAVGKDYQSIVEKAVKEGVDIIVMSTHGRTGFGRMLIGSVTEQVVRRSPCAVLSVRPAAA